MNDFPRVVVGLPVYNGQNFLKDAIKSVLVVHHADFAG